MRINSHETVNVGSIYIFPNLVRKRNYEKSHSYTKTNMSYDDDDVRFGNRTHHTAHSDGVLSKHVPSRACVSHGKAP